MQQLFKRVLLTLFPDTVTHSAMNPAGMFVSFVSPKQFFSVINRRMVENYKLNLFDIALDPFEVKIGFGDQPTLRVKDVDFYYSYCAAANLNGYRFFNPANIASALAIVVSPIITEAFEDDDDPEAILHMIFTVYLLVFVFLARLKVFPEGTKQEQYQRFVDVFFSFYQLLYEQTESSISDEKLAKIKKSMLKRLEVLFTLFYVYKRVNDVFLTPGVAQTDLYQWLLYDEIKEDKSQAIKDFMDQYDTLKNTLSFSEVEAKVLNHILPADVLLRYFFDDEYVSQVAKNLVGKIYDEDVVHDYLHSFLKNDDKIEEFLEFLLDYTHLKKNFFPAIQEYVVQKFSTKHDSEYDQEMNDFLSSIGDGGAIDESQIPEKVKQESETMEKFVNFYITFMGGFWTARGDSYYLRMTQISLLKDLTQHATKHWPDEESLYYYGGLLYSYSKNVFYYKYASENIRAGKERFNLPFRSSLKEVYSNIFILRLFDENFLATLLQDLTPRDIKIYTQHKQILSWFRERYSKQTSDLVLLSDDEFVSSVYIKLDSITPGVPDMTNKIKHAISDQQIHNVKESLYMMDFWIQQSLYELIQNQGEVLIKKYIDMTMVGVLAGMRDTLFGFLLYYTYIQQQWQERTKDFMPQVLLKLYVIDVLNIHEHDADLVMGMIDQLYDEFQEVLVLWISLDDNLKFFALALHNRQSFLKENDHNSQEVFASVLGEDIIWLRWFTKNVTYYNKRFVIPKD